MFSLRSNSLPCGAVRSLRLLTRRALLALKQSLSLIQIKFTSSRKCVMRHDPTTGKARGGRPKGEKLEGLSQQIETLRTARLESVEQLAAILEPLAQAMAALTDETRDTLNAVQTGAKEEAERINEQLAFAAKVCQEAAMNAQRTTHHLDNAGRRLELSHYVVAVMTGLVSATLASAFWLWRAPEPTVINHLDPKLVAEYLAPAIAAMKPSKGK